MHLYISERVQYFSTLLKSTNKITTKGDKFHSRLFYQFLRFSGDMIQQCSFSRLFALLSWARHSNVTLELVRKIKRYHKWSSGLPLNSYDKSDIVTLTYKCIVYFNFRVVEQPQSK